jgi:hypothetical protein
MPTTPPVAMIRTNPRSTTLLRRSLPGTCPRSVYGPNKPPRDATRSRPQLSPVAVGSDGVSNDLVILAESGPAVDEQKA